MAKTTTKAKSQRSTKKTAAPIPLTPPRSSIAAVVSESHERAEVYAKDRKLLQGLVSEATEKISILDKEVFKDNWVYLLAMLRLLKAYATKRYQEIPSENLLSVIVAIAYFVSPLDLIPDFVDGIGYLDDALIVRAVQRKVKTDLDRFMEWESGVTRNV